LDHAFYALEAVVSVTLMTNILQFGWWRCKARKGDLTHWQRYDAVYFLAIAVPLNIAYPIAVVLIYIGKLNYPDSKMWHSGSWFPNTPHGILLYIGKWIGVVFLTVGVFKVTQLHVKIAKKWRLLRGQRAATAPAATAITALDSKEVTIP